MPTRRRFIVAAAMASVAHCGISRGSNRSVPLFPVEICGKWGYMNSVGRVLIKPQFDEAWTFSEDLAAIRIGRLWGYVARDGGV